MSDVLINPPYIPAEVIKFLDAAFPHKRVNLKTTEREIFLNAGQLDVIDKLRDLHNQQFERAQNVQSSPKNREGRDATGTTTASASGQPSDPHGNV